MPGECGRDAWVLTDSICAGACGAGSRGGAGARPQHHLDVVRSSDGDAAAVRFDRRVREFERVASPLRLLDDSIVRRALLASSAGRYKIC
jgi:hypothetical protein